MIARPITNGGVIIGRIVSALRARLCRNVDRVATSAKTSPRAVVRVPTATERNNEFQAAPQRLPLRHPRLQSRLLKSFEKNRLTEYPPSSVMKAATSILKIGKKTKIVTITRMNPMADTMK